jgi:hypothetical protein
LFFCQGAAWPATAGNTFSMQVCHYGVSADIELLGYGLDLHAASPANGKLGHFDP